MFFDKFAYCRKQQEIRYDTLEAVFLSACLRILCVICCKFASPSRSAKYEKGNVIYRENVKYAEVLRMISKKDVPVYFSGGVQWRFEAMKQVSAV